MKYVILIHSNPQPWGHPTGDYVPEVRAMDPAERERANAEWEVLFTQITESGELLGGEALGDPAHSTLVRWDGEAPLASEGPYAETHEHLAGFFLLDVASAERALEIARGFSGPGETVELRPLM